MTRHRSYNVFLTLVVLLLVVLALATPPAAAASFALPAGTTITQDIWNPLRGGDSGTLLSIVYDPIRKIGPLAPTNVNEIVPWFWTNLELQLAFNGSAEEFLQPRGGALRESIKVVQVGTYAARVGFGWATSGLGWCWFWGFTKS